MLPKIDGYYRTPEIIPSNHAGPANTAPTKNSALGAKPSADTIAANAFGACPVRPQLSDFNALPPKLRAMEYRDALDAYNAAVAPPKKPAIPAPAQKKSLWDRAVDAGKDLIDKGEDIGSKAVDFGGKALNEIEDRSVDVAQSGLNIVTDAGGGFVRSVVEGGFQTGKGLAEGLNPAPLGKVFQGDFQGAWNDFKDNAVTGSNDVAAGLTKAVVAAPADAVIVGGQNLISMVQTATGLEPPGRKLNPNEAAELRKVYGNSVDYSQIRVKEISGDLNVNNLLAPHTVGNTIYIPKGWLNSSDPNYQAKKDSLLTHETGHVWQFQHGGTDYVGQALWSQAKASLGGGSRNGAYQYDNAVKAGVKWADLNPEQQAEMMQNAYEKGLFDSPAARFTLNDGTDVTGYVRDAINQVRKGQGAP